jgi:RNA recognition motif-containing protein
MKSIYVDQLPFEATEEDVRPLFEPFGIVHSVIIGSDRDLGELKCFALIELEETSDADPVAAVDGSIYRGLTLRVREAPDGSRPQQPSPAEHPGGSA